MINPETVDVTGETDLTDLYPMHLRDQKENDRLYITGKRWPKLYEIEITLPHTQ